MDPTILRDEADGLEELNEHHRWEAVLAAKVAAASALRRGADEIERLGTAVWDERKAHQVCVEMRNDAEAEIERLRAELQKIVDQAHYPDATIARRALGLPVTARDDGQGPKEG